MMEQTRRELRIFVACPEDCAAERDMALGVIEELNKSLGLTSGITLRALTWRDVPTQIGKRPEQVILDFIDIPENIDVFVGIMWKRFGTPTGQDYESGTEEEFYAALNAWNARKRPHIMFYFRTRLDQLRTKELEQYHKVLSFKTRLSEIGLFKEYETANDFSSPFRGDLTVLITSGRSFVPPPVVLVQTSCEYWEVWRDAFREERTRGERVEAYLYNSSTFLVKFMTISGRSVWSAEVEEALRLKDPEHFCFKLLLYDWNAATFAEKMWDERRTDEWQVQAAREKARDIARQFVNHAKALNLNLQVRLYQEYPVWRMMIIDDSAAYVGYYPKGKRGYEGPMFIYRNNDKGSLYYPVNQYFDALWKRSAPLTSFEIKSFGT